MSTLVGQLFNEIIHIENGLIPFLSQVPILEYERTARLLAFPRDFYNLQRGHLAHAYPLHLFKIALPKL